MISKEFEEKIRQLISPVNDQYPRPWMTRLSEPMSANIFIVGKNQRNGYSKNHVETADKYLDALFNRNGQGCRELYDKVTKGKPSPTRKNTDRLVSTLETAKVTGILETNVICYSTPMSSDLSRNRHVGGKDRGEEIFRYLLSSIKPRALIVHGASASRQLASILETEVGKVPMHANDICSSEINGMLVVVIPSLAPPAFNKWSSWSQAHFNSVANIVASHLL
ncbi:hypothetical protein [Herbaspirillum lusitanum]|uniref:hypothetical protein n=1 Tax=Herbaspirillum lusitanum TaxID=213312 RepID=UPI0012F4BAFF|nr:hypothetical protein [Herbaspirillum lusitanum]